MTQKIVTFFVLFVLVAFAIQGVAAVRVSRAREAATAAYQRGDYAAALPLFGRLADLVSDDAGQVAVIRRRMAECQGKLAPAATLPAASTGGAMAGLSDGRTEHRPPGAGEGERFLDIKQLGNFDYAPERGATLPADVKALDGLKLRTTGYMIPLNQAATITEFALVPSLTACCFGQPPTVQHVILVHVASPAGAAYTQQPVVVEGILRVREKLQDGVAVSLFELDGARVGG